jgi:hypothetical protein
MTVTKSVDLASYLGEGTAFRGAADTTHGVAVVAYTDATAGLTRFLWVNAVTGEVKVLTSTSTLLATGLGVSGDGTMIYACNRTQCQVLSNE